MANVKVPALLHKMSKTVQKAWYKKNNMEMPNEPAERSAAVAKRVKVAPRKASDVKPDSVRAINTARMAAYMAKGGRAPIGAAGSGGNSVMAGSNMSTVRGMITGIKAGFNPKVSLDPYESERAKKTGPRSLKLKKEEVEQVDEGAKEDAEKLLGGPVKTKPKMPPGKQPAGYRYVRALARRAMKAGLKKEEVEQIDEISPGLARKAAAASQVKAIEFSDYSGLSNLHNKEGKKEANRLNRKSDKAMDYIGKRQGQKGVDKVNRMVTRVVGEEVVTEAEGKVAVTPKEKSLAAHHGDPKKITYGDVIKARLKSAGKKVEEQANQDRPVPNPNATPKPQTKSLKEPKEPGTTDYTKELELDPSLPRMHHLELERPAVEAEVRKRQAELAKQATEKAEAARAERVLRMKKEEVEQVDEVTKKISDEERYGKVGAEIRRLDPGAYKNRPRDYQGNIDLLNKLRSQKAGDSLEPVIVTGKRSQPKDQDKKGDAELGSVLNLSGAKTHDELTNWIKTGKTQADVKPTEPDARPSSSKDVSFAQKLINIAKSKLNKINTKPEMDADVKGK
jgi:hypothetical protein